MTETTLRKRRRWLAWVIAPIAALIIILILLPWILSWGIAQAIVRSQMDKSINGTVNVEGLSLSWFGSQEIEHFVINGKDGVTSVDVGVKLNRGLFSLLLSGIDPIRIDLTGAISTTLDQDGALSLSKLLSDRNDKKEDPKNDKGGDKSSSDPMPRMDIKVHDFAITLTELPDKRVFTYDISQLDVDYQPGGRFLLEAKATTAADGQDGNITLKGTIDNLISKSGALTPKQAKLAFDIGMNSVGLPLTPPKSQLKQFTLRMTSDDLSKRLVIDGNASAQLANSGASTFKTNLVVNDPIVRNSSSQDFSFSPANLIGTIEGKNLPTALGQPFVAGSQLQLTDDIGETIDFSGTFGSADAPTNESADTSTSTNGNSYTIAISSSQLKANLTGTQDIASGGGSGNGSIDLKISPATVKRLAKVEVSEVLRTKLEISQFTIPTSVSSGGIEEITGTGTLAIENNFQLTASQDNDVSPVRIRDTSISFNAKGLGKNLELKGGAGIGSGSLAIDLTFDDLLKEDGSLQHMPGVIPIGTIALKDIPVDVLESIESLAASIGNVNTEQLLGKAISVDLTSKGPTEAREIIASVQAAAGTANGRVQVGPIGVSVLEANADLTLTPSMAAGLQKTLEEPTLILAGPAHLTASIEPFSLPEKLGGGLAPPEDPIKASLTLDQVTFSLAKSLPNGVELRRTKATVSYDVAQGGTMAADVSTRMRAAQGGQVADLATTLSLDHQSDGSKSLTGSAELTSINTPNLEKALGMPKGKIGLWTGDSGKITVKSNMTLAPNKKEKDALMLSAAELVVTTAMQNLNGRADVKVTSEMIKVTSPGLKTVFSSQTLGDILDRDVRGSSGSSGQLTAITVTNDVPLSLQVDALELPLSMFSTENEQPGDVHIDLTANMSQINIKSGDGSVQSLNPIKAHFATKSLVEGVVLKAASSGGSGSGTVDISGTIERLTNRKGIWTPKKLQIDLQGSITQVPTALLDAAADLGGVLTASLGELVSGSLTIDNFSRETGSLNLDLKSTNSQMNAALVNKGGVLRTDPDSPLKGQVIITPLLRAVVLSKMGPILGDIDAGQEPLRLSWSDAAIPINGEMKNLGGQLKLTVGEVTFDSGLPLMLALSAAQSSHAKQIKGSIDPITANITDGVMVYEPFAVHVDKFNFPISGKINFVTNEIDMTTKLPIYALGDVISELRPYVSDEEVPMEYVGPIGNAKWKLSSNFDLAKFILRATLQNTLRRRNDGN
ncbi:MAG: hypothetical protein P8J86_02150 [Phycisphaerales bacterium]|nr:hypothetical protein [Phycisphaerales bacterium]